jgi:hypothetical protein
LSNNIWVTITTKPGTFWNGVIEGGVTKYMATIKITHITDKEYMLIITLTTDIADKIVLLSKMHLFLLDSYNLDR